MSVKTTFIARLLFIFIFIFLFNQLIFANGDSILVSLFEKSIEELVNQEVTIATKSAQKLSQTPAVVSVITAEEIETMGFNDIFDILKIIPGFEYSQIFSGTKALGIRGVMNFEQGGRLLILLDGIPLNGVMYGSGMYFGHEFNLDAIEKIEIIRGPGSSLYGRNAFSSVLNIITKKGVKDNKLNIGTSLGSFNTYDFHSMYQIKKENLNANIAGKYFKTNNTNKEFDNGFGGKSPWDIGHENIYINANCQYKNLKLYFAYSNRNAGNNSPFYFMTDGNSLFKNMVYSINYSKPLSSKISTLFSIYGRNEKRIQNLEFLKPGVTDTFPGLPYTFSLLFPAGLYANAIFNDYTYGSEIQLNYQVLKNNELMVGIQADMHGVSNASAKINYIPDGMYTPNFYFDQDSNRVYYTKENMPEYPNWIENGGHSYKNVGIFVQDIHYFHEKLKTIVGARLDLDSETGGIFNPRLGLVWEINKSFNLKLLYGEAYRTPTTSEQYKKFGYDQGNENLDYEEIKTAEVVFTAKTNHVFSQLSLFKNDLKNIIQANVDSLGIKKYYNSGKNSSYGLDIENRFLLNNSLNMFYNFSFKISEDIKNGISNPHPNISKYITTFGLNYKLTQKINYSGYILYASPIEKYPSDNPDKKYISEDKIGNYYLFNSTLLFKDVIKNMDISINGYNLLNQEYYFQDNLNSNQPAQPGIHFLIKANYYFN